MPTTTVPVIRTITIAAIAQKTSSKGKPFWTITDEKDDFYSVFDEFVRGQIAEGQTLQLSIKEEHRGDKTYKNIVGLAGPGAALPTAPAGELTVNDLLPGAAPVVSQPPQQTPAPVVAQTPPPVAAPVAPKPPESLDMLDIRYKALGLAVQLFVAGRITDKQIEPNADQFASYMLGEQKSSSESAYVA